jgi:hypothetical protein
MDDRGYIKGIVVDLHNYLMFRSLTNHVYGNSSEYNSAYIYEPKFRKSIHKDSYIQQVNEIKSKMFAKISENHKSNCEKIIEKVRELTDCSILFYMKDFHI